MKFELNGESRDMEAPLSMRRLLDCLDLARRRVAVAINSDVVPRSRFETVEIQEGDHVEVIQAVGGG